MSSNIVLEKLRKDYCATKNSDLLWKIVEECYPEVWALMLEDDMERGKLEDISEVVLIINQDNGLLCKDGSDVKMVFKRVISSVRRKHQIRSVEYDDNINVDKESIIDFFEHEGEVEEEFDKLTQISEEGYNLNFLNKYFYIKLIGIEKIIHYVKRVKDIKARGNHLIYTLYNTDVIQSAIDEVVFVKKHEFTNENLIKLYEECVYNLVKKKRLDALDTFAAGVHEALRSSPKLNDNLKNETQKYRTKRTKFVRDFNSCESANLSKLESLIYISHFWLGIESRIEICTLLNLEVKRTKSLEHELKKADLLISKVQPNYFHLRQNTLIERLGLGKKAIKKIQEKLMTIEKNISKKVKMSKHWKTY